MKITPVTKVNEAAFTAFFPRSAAAEATNLIRLGVLDDAGKALGALSAKAYETHAEIISLYVLPEYRRKGCANGLMDALENLLKKRDFNMLTGEIFDDVESTGFFGSRGFEFYETRTQYSFTMGELMRSPLYIRLIKKKKIRLANRVSTLNNGDRQIFDAHVGNREYDPDWSSAFVIAGKCPSSLLACRTDKDINIIRVESLGGNKWGILRHLRTLAARTLEEFGTDPDVTFRMVFERPKIVANMTALMGGPQHLHIDGRYLGMAKGI